MDLPPLRGTSGANAGGGTTGVPSFARLEILNPSILIVASDGAECLALEDVLRGLGAVESTGSGRAALMRLGMTDFACMVIASPVPVEFGSEPLTLIELLERLAPNLGERIVVITDETETEAIRRARELDVHEILLRPFDPAELRGAVERCLRHQSLSAAETIPAAASADPRAAG